MFDGFSTVKCLGHCSRRCSMSRGYRYTVKWNWTNDVGSIFWGNSSWEMSRILRRTWIFATITFIKWSYTKGTNSFQKWMELSNYIKSAYDTFSEACAQRLEIVKYLDNILNLPWMERAYSSRWERTSAPPYYKLLKIRYLYSATLTVSVTNDTGPCTLK